MALLKTIANGAVLAVLIVSFGLHSFAQAPPPGAAGAAGQEKAKGLSGPRKQLATIIFAGLGGAILGLSTLSFYGRPQDKLSNIAIGFAFGVIGGTALVTFKAATNPSELYGRQLELERKFELTRAVVAPPTTAPFLWNLSWSF
jgi:hypothetical protein